MTASVRTRAGSAGSTRVRPRPDTVSEPPAHSARPTAQSPARDLRRWKRLRWAVRGTLILGVAASIAANVLHAQDNPISQAIAAWPPLALLLTVELIARVPVHRRTLAAARLVATTAIAGIAAWVSYWHMVGVTAYYGETGASPYLLPLSVDGLIIVASVSLVEISGHLQLHETASPVTAPTSTVMDSERESVAPRQPPSPTSTSPFFAEPIRSEDSASASTPRRGAETVAGADGGASTRRTAQVAQSDHESTVEVNAKMVDTAAYVADATDPAPVDTRAAVAYWQRRNPTISIDELAERVGRSARQVRRYLSSSRPNQRVGVIDP
jgi:hypothetical protein